MVGRPLGPQDWRECAANAVLLSSHVRVFSVEDRAVAVFGVMPVSEGVGQPWVMCTEETFQYPRQMLREGRALVHNMLESYDVLCGCVDARNDALTKWLTMLGFKFASPEPLGEFGIPFHCFELRACNVHSTR
jgi:hypothetical protein